MSRCRPSVFVGSSSEGRKIAQILQILLDKSCEVTIWDQGVFGLSKGTLESLVDRARDYDFAVLVLTPDDLVETRDLRVSAPRDNVVFELGLFMGALGRNRTFIVFDRTADLKLPSDIAGVTAATYEPHSSGNLQSALGAAAAIIETHISTLGTTNGNPGPPEYASRLEESLEAVGTQIQELRRGTTASANSAAIEDVDERYRLLAEEFFLSVPLKKAQEDERTARERIAHIQKTQEITSLLGVIKQEADRLASAYNACAKRVLVEIENCNPSGNIFGAADRAAHVMFIFVRQRFWDARIVFYPNHLPAIQFVRLVSPDGSVNIERMHLTNDSVNFVLMGNQFGVSFNGGISHSVDVNIGAGLPRSGLQPLEYLQEILKKITRSIMEYELTNLNSPN